MFIQKVTTNLSRHQKTSQGFTLLEVTFATGILFLTFILLVGALA